MSSLKTIFGISCALVVGMAASTVGCKDPVDICSPTYCEDKEGTFGHPYICKPTGWVKMVECHESDVAAVYWCQGEGGEARKPVCDNYGNAEVGDGDGDATGDTGGTSDTGAEEPEWNPPKFVVYDPTRDAYAIHEDFVAEIKLDWSLLASDRTYVESTPAGHYRLFNVSPGDLADALGLESGDVLRSVNGHELASLDALLGAYAELEYETEFELTVDRDGATLHLTYLISDW